MKIIIDGQECTLRLTVVNEAGEDIDECDINDPAQIKAILEQTGLDYSVEADLQYLTSKQQLLAIG
jgi:hypothetical protein